MTPAYLRLLSTIQTADTPNLDRVLRQDGPQDYEIAAALLLDTLAGRPGCEPDEAARLAVATQMFHDPRYDQLRARRIEDHRAATR